MKNPEQDPWSRIPDDGDGISSEEMAERLREMREGRTGNAACCLIFFGTLIVTLAVIWLICHAILKLLP